MIEVDRHRSEIIKPKYLVIKEINFQNLDYIFEVKMGCEIRSFTHTHYSTNRSQGKILDFTETGWTIFENQGFKNRKGF